MRINAFEYLSTVAWRVLVIITFASFHIPFWDFSYWMTDQSIGPENSSWNYAE